MIYFSGLRYPSRCGEKCFTVHLSMLIRLSCEWIVLNGLYWCVFVVYVRSCSISCPLWEDQQEHWSSRDQMPCLILKLTTLTFSVSLKPQLFSSPQLKCSRDHTDCSPTFEKFFFAFLWLMRDLMKMGLLFTEWWNQAESTPDIPRLRLNSDTR